MKQKHLIVLIAVLTVLLIGGLLKRAHKTAQFQKQEASSSLEVHFDKLHIEKIQLKKNESASYELIKKNSEWEIPSLWNSKADAAKIGNLLEKLLNLSGDLRADQAAVLSDFEIKDDEAFHLILLGASDKEIAHFILSYKAPQSGGSFVRLKNSNAVYLIEENLFSLLGIFGEAKTQELKAGYWAHLKYFSIDPTKTDSVILKKMDGSKETVVFDLGKQAEVWSVKGADLPFPVASEKLYRFLGQLSQGLAREVVDPQGKYGLDQPDWILTANETGRGVQTIRIKAAADKNSDFVYVSTTESNSILKVASSLIQSINVEPSYFEPTTPFLDLAKTWRLIRIKTQEKTVELKKETGTDAKETWKLEGQDPQPDQQKILEYLKSIENLQVVQYLQAGREQAKDIGTISLELENTAGESLKIEFGAAPDASGNYSAVKSGAQPAFLVSKVSVDNILNLPH